MHGRRRRTWTASLVVASVIAASVGVAGPLDALAASPAPPAPSTSVSPPRLASPAPSASTVPSAWPERWEPGPPVSTHEIVRDAFDTASVWWVGSDDSGSSSIRNGEMAWVITQDDQVIWDSRDLPGALDRVRVEAAVLVDQGSGGGGPLCGDADVTHALWAGLNGDGEWLVGRIVDGHLQVIDRGDQPRVRRHDVPVGAPYARLVTLECSAAPTGDRAVVWVDGVQVADVTDDPVGPYTSAGLVASADQKGLRVLFDDFAILDAPSTPASPGVSSAPSLDPSPGASEAP